MRPMDASATAQVIRTFEDPAQAQSATTSLPLYTSGATDPHIASMTAPVFGPGTSFAGALSVTGPIARFNRDAADKAASTVLESRRT